MVVDIYRQPLQAGRLTEDNFHGAHCFLAGFNIFFRCTIIGTGLVVCFDLLDLLIIQKHFRDSRMVLDGHSKAISYGLIHGISVDFIAEGLICFRYRRTCETHKGRLWERFLQDLCIRLGHHRFHILIGIFAELNLLGMFKLGSVRLVGEANNICPVIDQPDFVIFSVTEFLYGTDIKTAAFSDT